MEAQRVAAELSAQAEHDEDAAFNAQHALAREGDRAANQILAAGEKLSREQAAEQARKARADADAARFNPVDDDDTPATPPPAAAGRHGVPDGTPTAPPVAARTPAIHDPDDDDGPPDRWLT